MVFSRDGRTLYTSSYDRAVRLWEVRTGRMIHEVEGHTGWVWSVAFSPCGRRALSGGGDNVLRLWSLPN